MLDRIPLRSLLTLPYVLLVLLLAATIGGLSYLAGRQAIDELSGQLLRETVNRTALAIELHISDSSAVLEAAFPPGTTAPASLDDAQLQLLRSRFWIATAIHRVPNNYAFYGDRDGRFFGLYRESPTQAEVRLRPQGEGPRQIFRFTGIDSPLGVPTPEARVFEPRERPWFAAATSATGDVWSPIYIDFRSAELVITRARRVNDSQGRFGGVVATDLSLRRIGEFLQRLDLSPQAQALVVEADGQLVGVARGQPVKAVGGSTAQRVPASQSTDVLVAAAYSAVKASAAGYADEKARTTSFEGTDGQTVQVGYATLKDDAGLDWTVIVAVPRADFLGHLERSLRVAALLGVVASAVALLLGTLVLSTVTRELSRLADAARRMGEGQRVQALASTRSDELGDLSRSFADMQQRLFTDRLTGLNNREAVVRGISERIAQHRRRGDAHPFAVLFADFNRFKSINDRFGHAVGDAALRELAIRLRSNVRAHDMVARYAGDEFIILLDSVDDIAAAHTVRSHLEAALLEPLQALRAVGVESSAGATFGVALYPADGDDADALIRHADEDMYSRKGADGPAHVVG